MNKLIYTDLIKRIKKNNKKILVIGDAMLDKYNLGSIQRISPEAPVPVLKVTNEEYKLGGSANVAANIASYGIKTTLISSIAKDEFGEKILQLLKNKKINISRIFQNKTLTTTKIRSVAGNQQILRTDYESYEETPDNLFKKILHEINDTVSLVVLSDYNKGFLTEPLVKKIILHCNKKNLLVVSDPKSKDISKYSGSFIVTPNKKEALDFLQSKDCDESQLIKSLNKIRIKHQIKNLIMTESEKGIKWIQGGTAKQFPVPKSQKVFDVSGAGDTVIATIAAGLHAGFDLEVIITLANIAASIVIQIPGTAIITLEDLERFFIEQTPIRATKKILSLADLKEKIQNNKLKNKVIGFTNGCFDILHPGHVTYLEKAKEKVDYLILGLNTDQSIKQIKGPSRPIVNENDRANVLAGLSSVDAIVMFNETNPLNLIKEIKPNFLIKGNDYSETEVIGHKEIKKWGGKVILIEIVPGKSSTRIIKKITS